jgi:hypothetical protein
MTGQAGCNAEQELAAESGWHCCKLGRGTGDRSIFAAALQKLTLAIGSKRGCRLRRWRRLAFSNALQRVYFMLANCRRHYCCRPAHRPACLVATISINIFCPDTCTPASRCKPHSFADQTTDYCPKIVSHCYWYAALRFFDLEEMYGCSKAVKK